MTEAKYAIEVYYIDNELRSVYDFGNERSKALAKARRIASGKDSKSNSRGKVSSVSVIVSYGNRSYMTLCYKGV